MIFEKQLQRSVFTIFEKWVQSVLLLWNFFKFMQIGVQLLYVFRASPLVSVTSLLL